MRCTRPPVGRAAAARRTDIAPGRRASAWGGALLALALFGGCARVEPAPAWPALSPGEQAVLFTGDVLLGEHIEAHLARHGDGWALERLAPLLAGANAVAVIGNHEGPLTRRTETGPPNSRWNYGARPETAQALAAAGFTHLSLANNHAMDRQLAGLHDSREAIEAAGMVAFGGGRTEAEARAPLHLVVGGVHMAILPFMKPWSAYRAWEPKDGVGGVPLLTPGAVGAAVARARAEGATLVILFPHWGPEYKPVDQEQEGMADEAIAAGVDAIIGHHTHAAQGFERRGTVPVLWSLGNTMFGTGGRFGEEHGHGLLVRLVIAQGRPDRLEILVLRVNNNLVGWQPQPAPLREAERVLSGLAAQRGADIQISRGVGVLTWGP